MRIVWRRALVSVLAAGLGLFTLHVIDLDTGFAPSGNSGSGLVLLLGVGGAMATAAIAVSALAPRWFEAMLLFCVLVAWFGQQWALPAAPDLAFTVGLVLGGAIPVLVAHLALHLVRARWSLAILVPGYLIALGLLGLAASAFYDPQDLGCSPCAHNLLLVHADAAAWGRLNDVGITAMCLWLAVTLARLIWWLGRIGLARRRETTVVVLITVAFLLTSVGWFWHSRGTGALANDALARGLWRYQAWLLLALAASATLEALRSYLGVRALTRVVPDLSGDLDVELGTKLGDRSVVVAFAVEDGYVDRMGRSVDPAAAGRQVTVVRHGGLPLAAIGHRRGLDPRRIVELAGSISLKLDNERLHATAQAQLEEIRRSGRRLLEAGDAERRRLERDLHDGAQQSLVMLLLQLRMAELESNAARDAEKHLIDSVDHLRQIGHGLHPLLLDRAGLAVALEALAETRPLSIKLTAERRFQPVVESTAYQLVERCCAKAPATALIHDHGAELVIEVEVEGEPSGLAMVLDRIATLEGRCAVEAGQRTRVAAALPV